MTKVFLVEDEYVVREGIRNNIAWAENGFDFCGEAADGELALPLIEKEKPDIVITDIKMPFMDGLELSRLIRNEFPDMEIVFLTGYAEFEFAKEAIKLGVAEYLSKPVSGDELLHVLSGIKKRIEEKKQEQELRNHYLKEMEENVERDKNALFTELVSDGAHTADLLLHARNLGIELTARTYGILLLKIKSAYHGQDEFSKSVIRMFEQIDALCESGNPIVFDRSPEGKAYIFKAETPDLLKDMISEFAEAAKAILIPHKHISFFGGIGEPVSRLGEFSRCFESANRAYAHRFLVDENLFLYAADVKGKTIVPKQTVQDEDNTVVPLRLDSVKFMDFLKLGESGDVRFFIDELLEEAGEAALRSSIMRQYIVVDAYLKINDFLSEIGANDLTVEDVNENVDTLNTDYGARDYLVRVTEAAVGARERISRSRYGELVSEIMKYINENYADDELSLNSVAQVMNFSPNHLSMIFCRETGKTFIKYLTDLRISRAKELLRCTAKRSGEICEEVGYKDPHYFSYMFKKNVGMTPTDYRENKR